VQLGLALVLILSASVVGSIDGGCGGASAWTACSSSNSGTQVDLTGTTTTPGTPGTRPNAPSTPGSRPGSPPAPPPPEDCGPLGCRPGYSVVTIPDVTIDDLASFRPAAPSLTVEPTGFGVAGLPTNLVAAASEQLLAGELLGWAVTVRFVPAGFVFDNGDGTTTRSRTGGSSWASSGVPQFSPTATSHVYRERGQYSVGVTVQYTASVNFGTGSWRPVPGFVTASAGGYGIRVVEATTALVDRTCVENPGGPGC